MRSIVFSALKIITFIFKPLKLKRMIIKHIVHMCKPPKLIK